MLFFLHRSQSLLGPWYVFCKTVQWFLTLIFLTCLLIVTCVKTVKLLQFQELFVVVSLCVLATWSLLFTNHEYSSVIVKIVNMLKYHVTYDVDFLLIFLHLQLYGWEIIARVYHSLVENNLLFTHTIYHVAQLVKY